MMHSTTPLSTRSSVKPVKPLVDPKDKPGGSFCQMSDTRVCGTIKLPRLMPNWPKSMEAAGCGVAERSTALGSDCKFKILMRRTEQSMPQMMVLFTTAIMIMRLRNWTHCFLGVLGLI